jgi:hypothetical protein
VEIRSFQLDDDERPSGDSTDWLIAADRLSGFTDLQLDSEHVLRRSWLSDWRDATFKWLGSIKSENLAWEEAIDRTDEEWLRHKGFGPPEIEIPVLRGKFAASNWWDKPFPPRAKRHPISDHDIFQTGRSIVDAWKEFVLGDPKVQASGARLATVCSVAARVFLGTYMYTHGESFWQDNKWPVVLDRDALLSVFRYHYRLALRKPVPVRTPSGFDTAFEEPSPDNEKAAFEIALDAAETLAERNRSFYDHFRSSHPKWVARGTAPDGMTAPIGRWQWDRRDLLLDTIDNNLWGSDGSGSLRILWNGVGLWPPVPASQWRFRILRRPAAIRDPSVSEPLDQPATRNSVHEPPGQFEVVSWAPNTHSSAPAPSAPLPMPKITAAELQESSTTSPSVANARATATRRGRPPKWDWGYDIEPLVFKLLDERGDFSDPGQVEGWKTQSDLIVLVLGYMRKTMDLEDDDLPGDSTMKRQIAPMVTRWRQR